MMMIGYALDHPSGTYQFYNPNTDTVIISNSVKWSAFNRWEAANVATRAGQLFDANNTNQDHESSDDDFEEEIQGVRPAPKVSFAPTVISPESTTTTIPSVETSEVDSTVPGVQTRSQSHVAGMSKLRQDIAI